MSDPTHLHVRLDLDVMVELRTVLFEAADAVAGVLHDTSDWGPSGLRDGQYAVDLRADRACLDVLERAGMRVLSEESGVTTPVNGDANGPVVVVDPLDGSTNASRGVPWYATALCVVDAEGPAVAVVVNQATGDRFSAIRGQGATRNASPIAPSGATRLDQAIVGTSGLPSHHYGWAQYRTLGAAAPDICAVANGVLDAWCDMVDDGHGVWDYLAALLILQEAGGVGADVLGRDLAVLDHTARRSPVVAATPELLEQLLEHRRRPTSSATRP